MELRDLQLSLEWRKSSKQVWRHPSSIVKLWIVKSKIIYWDNRIIINYTCIDCYFMFWLSEIIVAFLVRDDLSSC